MFIPFQANTQVDSLSWVAQISDYITRDDFWTLNHSLMDRRFQAGIAGLSLSAIPRRPYSLITYLSTSATSARLSSLLSITQQVTSTWRSQGPALLASAKVKIAKVPLIPGGDQPHQQEMFVWMDHLLPSKERDKNKKQHTHTHICTLSYLNLINIFIVIHTILSYFI